MSLRRREFIAGLSSAAAWPLSARAQQPWRVALLINTVENDRVQEALDAFATEPTGGIIILPTTASVVHQDIIIHLAHITGCPQFTATGPPPVRAALISYGSDATDQYRRGAF